ncbi:MAG: urea ABC transporter permease subunit UrtB [Pseudomonadota bacterium]
MKLARSLSLVLLCLIAMVSPLAANEFPRALAGLAEKSFKKRLTAINDVAASGHERAQTVLEALSKRKLYVANPGKRLVIKTDADGYQLAATGEPAGEIAKSALKRVKTNNRLRKAIRNALGTLTLRAPDAAQRLAAAQTIFASRDTSALPLLTAALKVETDPQVRSVMERAQAAITLLGSAGEADKLEAISTIRQMGNQEAIALLSTFGAAAKGAEQAAASQAIAEIERTLALWSGAQNVIYGLSLGSVLLLAAIGLAITFGVMGVINMAHGEMVMLGAYVTFAVQELLRTSFPGLFDWSLLFAIPLAFLVSGCVGIALERGVIRFLYGRPLETLLATWGVSLILQQAVRTIFGPNNREVGNPSWMSGSVELGQLALTWNRLYIILFALLIFAGLYAAMRWTSFGLQMRSVVQNRQMAGAMGIRTKWIDALTFGLGSGIAGIAGVAISQIDNVSPNLGQSYIIDSFMVVVFGGVGNLWGTLVGAMTLGVANKFLEPYAGAVLAKIFVLVFIILFIQKRPRGLFALKGRGIEA